MPTTPGQHTLDREQVIARPRAEVFAFFADAANLQRLTPASLRFRVLSQLPATMIPGTLIDYKISLFGVPFAWRTLITEFAPATRFVDVQLKGPYRSWCHTHEFLDVTGGTLVRDHVDYQLPLGRIGDVVGYPLVRHQLEHIFDFRRDTLARFFE